MYSKFIYHNYNMTTKQGNDFLASELSVLNSVENIIKRMATREWRNMYIILEIVVLFDRMLDNIS